MGSKALVKGGGGVSCNFKSEAASLRHIKGLFAGCQECSVIDFKKNMKRIDDVHLAVGSITDYLCEDCDVN